VKKLFPVISLLSFSIAAHSFAGSGNVGFGETVRVSSGDLELRCRARNECKDDEQKGSTHKI